ncbi:Uncharacterized protein ANR2 [Wickerhamiella sorbophila]|uniref:Uncharacterized protein ANR2 n=1 Tax=Wickerhamiella sorbophila TaxID=45607 RepID=A0A2T0FNF1_9ASCO|nr:Uncharacterized protein ANR2 [Wickerhamiella sorbophila]PRT56516.1 Uncharacterized protein ANR2 [Wickerhamiella sorbophila]
MLVLAEFDANKGNQVVWQSEAGNLNGIEFKMLPSGLHTRTEDTIYFKYCDQMGCAVYGMRGNTRETAKFYSLAVVSGSLEWNQETFLRDALEKFLSIGDTDVLPKQLGAPDPRCHPVLGADLFLGRFGPRVFELWKAGLARMRILLFVNSSVHDASRFAYVLSRMTTIPSDVRHLLPEHRQALQYTDPEAIYNVTLHDLADLQQLESFVACSTDELLTHSAQNAADIIGRPDSVKSLLSGNNLEPTWTDSHRFSVIAKAFDVPAESSGIMTAAANAAANGLIWWASAGESASLDAQEVQPLLEASPEGVAVVGQFQNYTRGLIHTFSRLAEDSDGGVIRITAADLAALGLDIFCRQDREFLQRFSLVWFDRPVWFTSWCCCV